MKNFGKNLFIAFLAISFLSVGTSADAFLHKKTKVKKPSRAESVLNETLNNSMVKEEYKSGTKVVTPESEEQQAKINDSVIEGSVAKNLELDLGDCIKLALGNNPKIRAALNSALAAHSRINQSWSEYFPQFNWTTGLERSKGLKGSREAHPDVATSYLMGSISASQLIYDFGYVQNEVTIKKLAYEQYKTQMTSTINQVVYEVKDDYYKLLLAIENENVAKDTVNKYDLFYRQAKAFYEVGTSPKIDVTIAQVNLSNAKLNLIQAKNDVDSAIATLDDAMGLPELGKYRVKDRLHYLPIKITFEDAVAIAKQSRPDLKSAELQVQQARQEVKLAKKSYFPTLEAEAGISRGGYEWGGSTGYNYGVYFKFPVVNGMLVANQISEAKALYNKELAEAETTRNEIHLEIHDAYLNLDVKQHQIPVSALQVKQAKENYDLSFGRYKVGVGNPVELKDAENAYQQARITYYKTLYEFNSSKAALEKAIGRNIVGGTLDKIDLQTETPIKNQIYNNKRAIPKEVRKPIKLPLISKKKANQNKTLENVSSQHPEKKPLVKTQTQQAKPAVAKTTKTTAKGVQQKSQQKIQQKTVVKKAQTKQISTKTLTKDGKILTKNTTPISQVKKTSSTKQTPNLKNSTKPIKPVSNKQTVKKSSVNVPKIKL